MTVRVLIAALALVGCTSSTGVMPLGGGVFTVAVESDMTSGGLPAAQRQGVEDAEKHCAAQGKKVAPGPVSLVPQTLQSYAVFSMQFRCE